MRSASSMSDVDTAGLQSALHSSSATTLTHLCDDSAATASGASAAIAGSADGDSPPPPAAAAEAQAEAMMAHLALGLDSHDEQFILGGQVCALSVALPCRWAGLGAAVACGFAGFEQCLATVGPPPRVSCVRMCARARSVPAAVLFLVKGSLKLRRGVTGVWRRV